MPEPPRADLSRGVHSVRGDGGREALLGWVSESDASGADLDAAIQAALARRLIRPGRTNLPGQLLLIGFMGAVCWGQVPALSLAIWFFAVLATSALRVRVPRHLLESGRDPLRVREAVRVGVLIPAVAWGLGFAIVAPGLEIERLFLALIIFSGMISASAITLSADPPSFRGFGILFLVLVGAGVLRNGLTDTHWLAITALVAFEVFLEFLMRQSHRGVRTEVEGKIALRRHDERAGRESAFLTALLQSVPDAIVVMEPEGKILGVNRAFEEIFGWSPAEALGRDIYDLVVPEEGREQARTVIHQLLDGEYVVRDLPRVRRDGRPVSTRISAAPVEGIADTIVVLYSDITRLKEIEAALAEAKELAEQASRAKSEFLANMSHEIRTPMNAIIGMAELLRETELSAVQRDYVEVFTAAGDTLLALINQILDLSKIEAGHLELDRRDFDVWELVDHTIQVFAVPAHRKGVELAARVEPGVPRWIESDPDRLRQVLVNLLGNAVKFTTEGEVVLAVRVESGDGESAGGDAARLRFEVRDTGPGIAEDRREAIFERFTQADSSVTRQFGGTGLGLTISTALVKLMDGEMGIESELGSGSTFYFVVPLERGRAQDSEDVSGPPGEFAGLRTLVVDDNATNRLILREILVSWGAQPTAVANGDEALEELARAKNADAPYQLVLLDGQMPGTDGFEVAERIRSDPSLAKATLMMLTSSGNQAQDVERAHAIGIDTYLVKPVRRTDLLQAVRAALLGADLESPPDGGAAVPSEPAEAPEPGKGARILLVEDTAENRMLVEAFLKSTSHRVQAVETGEDAVETYKGDPSGFDLVFMDIRMPGIDGYEATRQIRAWEAEQELAPVPIVALTAHALDEEKLKSAEAGCDAHLTKPIKKAKLVSAIEGYARGYGGRPTAAESGAGGQSGR